MTFKFEERAKAIDAVIKGLSAGTPLTIICGAEGMPAERTFREWVEVDADLSADIARAREMGFDQIALDALSIADDSTNDTHKGRDGAEIANTEWISRSKLRVETRLKLLAKWDPKRYGELLKLGNPDGSNIDSAAHVEASRARVIRGD